MRRFLIALLAVPMLVAASPPPKAVARMNGRVFDRAWSLVAKHYWDPKLHGIDWRAARKVFRPQALAAHDSRELYDVIGRMLERVGDSHVYAISPARFDASGASFGFVSVIEDGVWRVLSVDPDSPAARGGVEVGWQLLSVDGQVPTSEDPPPANGEIQTHVFVDDDAQKHIVALRAERLPPDQIIGASHLPGKVLLLRIDDFSDGVDRWLRDQLANSPKPDAVILDLRECDGGDGKVAARVTGEFYEKKRELLVRSGRDAGVDEVRSVGHRAYRGPLVVMVGRRSASAAEAIAALVDESGRGTTIGEKTAGALTGGQYFHLPGGGELSIATSDVHTPAGKRIEGIGYMPKIAVPWPLAGRRAGLDPQLKRALATLSS